MSKYQTASNNEFVNTPVTSISSSYSALPSDYIIEVSSVASAVTVTLPAPSTAGAASTFGKIYIIKNTSGATTNPITIAPASGTIDGSASLSITTAYGSFLVFSDGVSWYSQGSSSSVTVPVSVTNGGTGNSSLTAHAVLVGEGTSAVALVGPSAIAGQILQSGGPSSDPLFSTATYPSSTTVSQLLYSSTANAVSGLATANSASLVTSSTGVPVWSATMTNGQMIMGSTGATPVASTLTAGPGVSITNGAGSVTITDMPFSSITSSQTLAVSNGYFVTSGALALLLPATSVVGDKIEIVVAGGTSFQVTQAAGQQIFVGASSTTTGTGGSITATGNGYAIRLVCSTANLIWYATSFIGNILVT